MFLPAWRQHPTQKHQLLIQGEKSPARIPGRPHISVQVLLHFPRALAASVSLALSLPALPHSADISPLLVPRSMPHWHSNWLCPIASSLVTDPVAGLFPLLSPETSHAGVAPAIPISQHSSRRSADPIPGLPFSFPSSHLLLLPPILPPSRNFDAHPLGRKQYLSFPTHGILTV